MKQASERADKVQKKIITNKPAAYIDGIELAFGAETEHIQSKPFVSEDSTNVIERFQGTLKDRAEVVRGFKNIDSARLPTKAWLVHYNFFKEHETLGNIPPAIRMATTPIKEWSDMTRNTATIMPVEQKERRSRLVIPVKRKYPKRKPTNLKSKANTELTLSTMRNAIN